MSGSRMRPIGIATRRTAAGLRPSALLIFAVTLLLGHQVSAIAQSQSGPAPSTRTDVQEILERAERAYTDEDFAAAEQAYAAVVAADAKHPRALFRLAQLRRTSPVEAAALFERYVALVPRDPWGHLALASAYAAAGRRTAALEAFDEALALEPQDRDIALGGPRLYARLGMPDRAIAAYRAWLADHPEDGEAWRELSEQMQRAKRHGGAARAGERALRITPDDTRLAARVAALRMRTAPAIEVGGLAIGETDLATVGGSLSFDASAGEAARVGVSFLQRRISGLGDTAGSRRALFRGAFAPRADLDVQVLAGLVQTYLPGTDAFDRTRPEITARVRRRPAAGGAIVDVRALHGPVDVTPQLALDELTRSQVAAAIDVPVAGRLRLRSAGRLAAMTRSDEQNLGTRYGMGLAVRLADAIHVSGQTYQARYRQPAAGYFAPARADTVEAGLDVDREWGAFGVGLDAGAGAQRVRKHGYAMGGWRPVLRAWAVASWSMRPGRALVVEAETYDTQVSDAVVAAEHWRYASITASFRVALR